jgi:DNA repair protein RecN (Recombination protein N)
MLRLLTIRDMVLIETAEIAFEPGLNVLTGETGSGKSILLDALGFVLGWRVRADLVRAGAETGEATAVFEVGTDHPAQQILDDAGLPRAADGTLILRRQAGADGRRAQWVNDRRISAEALRAVGETLVELHGQHDDRGLLDPRGHRALLDAFAGAQKELAATRASWAVLGQARAAAAAAVERQEAAQRDADFLRHAAGELAALAPRAGEDAELDARRRRMQAAGRIREDVARAHAALSDEGAGGILHDAARWLESAAPAAEGALDAALEALTRARGELHDAQVGVERALEALAADPRDLEAVEERLFALRAAARKHGCLPDDLPALSASLGERLDLLEAGASMLAASRDEVARAEAVHAAAAAALSQARHGAAARLDAAMAAELAPLKLERARFRTAITAAEPGPDGCDRVGFVVAPNPGAPEGPIERIASGGELSRFLLALKVCLAGAGPARTLIFDEIDRGVGGATADAVGRRLAVLAHGAQVLCVTHSAQVAARGAHHWRIEKTAGPDATRTTATALGAAERVEEIARMLAGDRVTGAARAAAQALLSP